MPVGARTDESDVERFDNGVVVHAPAHEVAPGRVAVRDEGHATSFETCQHQVKLLARNGNRDRAMEIHGVRNLKVVGQPSKGKPPGANTQSGGWRRSDVDRGVIQCRGVEDGGRGADPSLIGVR